MSLWSHVLFFLAVIINMLVAVSYPFTDDWPSECASVAAVTRSSEAHRAPYSTAGVIHEAAATAARLLA